MIEAISPLLEAFGIDAPAEMPPQPPPVETFADELDMGAVLAAVPDSQPDLVEELQRHEHISRRELLGELLRGLIGETLPIPLRRLRWRV